MRQVKIQSEQYQFPYHYLPYKTEELLFFSRGWRFAPSYVAGTEIVSDEIYSFVEGKALPSGEELKWLDFGCGDGALLNGWDDRDIKSSIFKYGVDFDKRALEWGKLLARGNIDFFSSLDEVNGLSFDIITLVEVLEHIPPEDCKTVLESLIERLNSEGILIITVPSVNKRLSEKHFRHFDFDTLKTILPPGIEIKKLLGFERYSPILRLIRKIYISRGHRFEWSRVNKWLVKKLKAQYSNLNGCGRIYLMGKKVDSKC